ATPGAVISLRNVADGTLLCTTTAAANGQYACQLGVSPGGITLADGVATVAVDATLNGATSPATIGAISIHATPSMVPPVSPTRITSPDLCVAPQAGIP